MNVPDKTKARRLTFKLCAFALIGAQLVLLFSLALFAAGETPQDPIIWDIAEGPLTITESQHYLVAGNAGESVAAITVAEGVSCSVTLRGAAINHSAFPRADSPIAVMPGAHLTLRLEGTNRLESPAGKAAIWVAQGASLDIHGPGALIAIGNGGGAGIGSDAGDAASGVIGIYSGAVEALSTGDGAGIGGGFGSAAGRIVICGGAVTAQSTYGGAGIGGGAGGKAASVEIYGGQVAAYGGTGTETLGGGAGIGGGAGGDCGTAYLYCAAVTATGGAVTVGEGGGGAGIGGGGATPAAGSFGGSCSSVHIFTATGIVEIHGGDVGAGGGGTGAGIGGGGAAGTGAMPGIGRAVSTYTQHEDTLTVAAGSVTGEGLGAAGAAYGDGGGNAAGTAGKTLRPEALPVPAQSEIAEIYLNGYLCSYDDASNTDLATVPGSVELLGKIQLCAVVTPGSVVAVAGQQLVNGVSMVDFSEGEPLAITASNGGAATSARVLALATGQTYDTSALPATPPDAPDAGNLPIGPAQPEDTSADDAPLEDDLPLALAAAGGGLLVALVVTVVFATRKPRRSREEDE